MEPLTESQQKVVLENDGLAIKFGSQYARKYGLDRDDCIQCARLGLFRAVQKYNPDEGYRFSTYAYQWMRSHLLKHMENTYSIVRYKSAFWSTEVPRDISLDQQLESGATILDLQVDATSLPDTDLEIDSSRQELLKIIQEFLPKLTPLMHTILFDVIYSETPRAVSDVAKQYSLSNSRVRAVQGKLVRMLKNHFSKYDFDLRHA